MPLRPNRRLFAACTALAVVLPLVSKDGPATRVQALAEATVLFDGEDLDDWVLYTEADGVTRDSLCTVEDGVLTIAGKPTAYLATRRWYRDYSLELEWRWPGERGGNSGVLVHTTTPLLFYGWPKSMEVQLHAGSAGDFWVIGDGVDITVDNQAERRAAPREGDLHSHRRIANLTDGSEKPIGEWNSMRISTLR